MGKHRTSAWAFGFAPIFAATGIPGLAQEPPAQAPARAESAGVSAIEAENAVVGQHFQAGRFAEALDLAEAVAKRAEAELGPDHPVALTSIHNLGAVYVALGRHAEAEPLYLRTLAGRERVLGSEHPATLFSLTALAMLYYEQGRFTEAEPLLLKAQTAQERILGSEHPATLLSLHNRAVLYVSQGRYAEAEPLFVRALTARENVIGSEHSDTLMTVSDLASLYHAQGRYAEAEPLYVRALTTRERVLGSAHPDTLVSVNNLASLYNGQARYAEAETLYLRALAGRERALGSEHPATLTSVNNLAALYRAQGRHAEAEPLYLRALAGRERSLGNEHPDTLASVHNLAMHYYEQGRHAEAERLYLRLLPARERVLGREHPDTLVSASNLGVLYASQGRYAEAEPLYLRVLRARERVLGSEHPDTLVSANNLAALYRAQGRYAEAEALYAEALAAMERVLGAEHPYTITVTENLAIAKLATSDPDALEIARKALSSSRARASLTGDFRGDRSEDTASGADAAAFLYARAAWSAAQRPSLSETFEALQLIDATSVGRALARSAALATLDPAGQALAREREDVVGQIEAVDEAFAQAAGREGRGEALAGLRTRRAALFERLAALNSGIEAGNPRYFELTNPQPVPLDALRGPGGAGSALLRDDEALILLTPGNAAFPEGQRHGFAFAVTREGAAWAELPLAPEALANLVDVVRAGSAIVDPRIQQPVAREQAKALYDALFGAPEIARLIADKPSWILSPQGDLLTAPFAALVTRDPQGDDADPAAWASTAWLGTERALSILPDVHMLRALRGLDRPDGAADAPYFGIADPAFEGSGATEEVRSAASYFRGAIGSPGAIIELAPLPSTRGEAEAVARALGAGPGALLTGSEATEAALRAQAERLADSRVIHFATHALVSGEMDGLAQPALALMPPTGGAAVDRANDGLLTAAEAAALRLNAEWVILSACNTAAGGGKGAEGLSGLARSFFYAGAGSLLVSQWQVRDDSGAMLVAETVKAFAGEEGISRAEALRRAMRKVIASKNARGESFAHPQDWAPFMLVGVDR